MSHTNNSIVQQFQFSKLKSKNIFLNTLSLIKKLYFFRVVVTWFVIRNLRGCAPYKNKVIFKKMVRLKRFTYAPCAHYGVYDLLSFFFLFIHAKVYYIVITIKTIIINHCVCGLLFALKYQCSAILSHRCRSAGNKLPLHILYVYVVLCYVTMCVHNIHHGLAVIVPGRKNAKYGSVYAVTRISSPIHDS